MMLLSSSFVEVIFNYVYEQARGCRKNPYTVALLHLYDRIDVTIDVILYR